MSDQSRINDQNRIRSAGKVRRLTLDDLGISVLDEQDNLDKRLAEEAAEAAEHMRGDEPLHGAAVASAGGVIYAAPRIVTPTKTTHAVELAVLKALSDGVDQVVAATVYVEEGEVSVCGACRQLLAEYGSDGVAVRGVAGKEQVFEASIADLLPTGL